MSCSLTATSHTRLRARDYYTPSTLIGGNGGAGPSLLHTTFERPTEYVNAKMMDKKFMHGFLHGIKMDHVSWSLGVFSKTTLGCKA